MKKKILLIIGAIIVVLALVFAFFIYPKISYNKDVSILKNKVSLVKEYFMNNTGDIKEIKSKLKEENVSSARSELEKEINNYLNNVLDVSIEYNNIDLEKIENIYDDDKLKDNLDDNLKFLNEEKEKIASLKELVNNISKIDDKKIENNDNKELLKELFKDFDLDKMNDKIDSLSLLIEDNIKQMEYLKNNKNTWNYENKKIVFNKRNNYNEYKKMSDNCELIKDTTGPVITASDITISKGTKLNISDKVKCEDAVDGKVECVIKGSYDTSKVGSYNITISSTDQNKNNSSKSIKLIVKEQVVKKVPYYIEVIRNQNVVIVYGLDSNNNYTKIVKVFVCSVGKSTSKTPTGTFKTSDKAKWGWLVGNLYGQYYTRITGSILFHSVPYTKKTKNSLEWDEYNKLGTAASKGCVRMTVKDVKWIYDNCPRGTTVKIYDGNLPGGVSKPSAQKISSDSPNKGWDPTDPDSNNPWKK